MSKLVDGQWQHRIYCNYFNIQGPCKCCERHPQWPYPDEVMAKHPGMSFEEAVDAEIAEKWPDAKKIG